jgi:REP element-mobilizing transposase RayT
VVEFGFATQRHLPHLQKGGRTYFVTFVRRERVPLPPAARDIVMTCLQHDHERTYWLHAGVVMPDHVHILITPSEPWTLSAIMKRLKGVSARQVNQLLGRTGPLWRDESFDHMLRSDESLAEKAEYIRQNPVRAKLVARPTDYPWQL